MKNKSVIALMLAFTVSFTSVCPALAAENTAVESEEVTESEPEEVSEENAVPAEETAPEEQNVSGADEALRRQKTSLTKLQMQLRSQRTAPMRPLASQ